MQAGNHLNVKIVGCFCGQSKNKETPYFGIDFMNQDGETIEHLFYLTDKTAERQIQTLHDLGFMGKDLSDLANPKLKIDELFGTPTTNIDLVVETEEYTNNEGEIKTKNVVKWVNVGKNKIGAERVGHGDALKIFKTSKYNGLLMQTRKELGENKPKDKPAEEKGKFPSEEDLPF